MADRVAGKTNSWASLEVHRSGHGGPGASQGRGQAGAPKGGRADCARLGGDSTGVEATGLAAADRVRNTLREAACPAEEGPS